MASNSPPIWPPFPDEISVCILDLAVKEEKPVEPRQVVRGSNKFHNGDSNAVPTVAAVRMTCTSFNRYFDREGSFYKVNTFRFIRAQSASTYIAAIQPRSRNSLKRLIVEKLDGYYFPCAPTRYTPRSASVLWALLERECSSLEDLEVSVCFYGPCYFRRMATASEKNYLNLRGLKRFSVVITGELTEWVTGRRQLHQYRIENLTNPLQPISVNYTPHWHGDFDEYLGRSGVGDIKLDDIKAVMLRDMTAMSKPRPDAVSTYTDAQELIRLLLSTGMDIWGEGRSQIGDPRPGIVSGRTRAKTKGPSSVGTNRPPTPMYSIDGRFLGHVGTVMDGKVGDNMTIAFFEAMLYTCDWELAREGPSWVAFDALMESGSSLCSILLFYDKITESTTEEVEYKHKVKLQRLPHPMDLADALLMAGNHTYADQFRVRAKMWHDRSPRAEFSS